MRLRFATGLVLASTVVVTTAARAGLPDLARGLAALERGDVAAAESDLQPLAERGYLKAQTALGRLYARQDDPQSAAKAVRWFGAAVKQDPSVRVPLARALMRTDPPTQPAQIETLLREATADGDAAAAPMQLRLYREYPDLTEQARAARLAAEVAKRPANEERAEAIAWYRANLAGAEHAHAQALLKLCTKDRSWLQECYVDLARHYRSVQEAKALEALRKEALARFKDKQLSPDTLERFARSLAADDLPGTPSPAAAYALLEEIPQPSPTAMARKAKLLVADPGLDPEVRPEELLRQAIADGSTEASLYLGRLYLTERNPLADPEQAQRLLDEAAPTLPAAHFYLGRLHERGYRGRSDPAVALGHYLKAARAGYPRADLALAQMYWNNRGVKVDVEAAYAFARLALHNGVVGGKEFLQQLRQEMSPEQVEQGQKLAEREYAARQASTAVLSTARAPSPEGD